MIFAQHGCDNEVLGPPQTEAEIQCRISFTIKDCFLEAEWSQTLLYPYMDLVYICIRGFSVSLPTHGSPTSYLTNDSYFLIEGWVGIDS